MQKLKLFTNTQKHNNTDRISENADSLIDLFPNPQYFQAHFQYIHDNTRQLHNEVAQLKETAAHPDEKLGRLLALLNSPADPVC